MGSDTLCMGCNLREENPAPEARHECRLSLPGQPAFMRRHMAAGDFMGSDAFYIGRRLLWDAVRSIGRRCALFGL